MNYPRVEKPTKAGPWWLKLAPDGGWHIQQVYQGRVLLIGAFTVDRHKQMYPTSEWAGPILTPDEVEKPEIDPHPAGVLCMKCFNGPDAYCPHCAARGRPPFTPDEVSDEA